MFRLKKPMLFFNNPKIWKKLIWWSYSWDNSDEKLRSIGSWACVGHAEGVGSVMPQCGMELVLKLSTPDAFSTHTRARRISRLDHEALHTRSHLFNSHQNIQILRRTHLNTPQVLIPWWHDGICGRCNNRSCYGRRSSPLFWGTWEAKKKKKDKHTAVSD